MPTITKRLIDTLTPEPRLRIIRDDALAGFCLQVTPKGKVSFAVSYTLNGVGRRKVIGPFGPLTVNMARKLAQSHLAKVAVGQDPFLEIVATAHITVEEVFETWMDQHVGRHCKPRSADGYRQSYATHSRPRFGATAAAKLEHAAVALMHVELEKRPIAANHAVRTLRAMLRWAEQRRLVKWPDGNPARGHKFYEEKPSTRTLSVAEVREFWEKLPSAPMAKGLRRILQLELLLAQRSGEIAEMRKSEVDLDIAIWIIPADKNKGSRRHEVPLPPMARQIIADAIGEVNDRNVPWVFESNRNSGETYDSKALGHALRRTQRPESKAKKPKPGGAKSKHSWVWDFRDAEDNPNPLSPHDLRRTASSIMEMRGHSEAVRGAVLNHSAGRSVTARHYSQGDLLRLKRSALLDLEKVIRLIIGGSDPFARSIEDDRDEERRVLDVEPPATNVVAMVRS